MIQLNLTPPSTIAQINNGMIDSQCMEQRRALHMCMKRHVSLAIQPRHPPFSIATCTMLFMT